MRRKVISVGLLIGFLVSILMVTGAFAQKDVITLDVPFGKVTFAHKKHVDMKYDCTKCHHTWK
jgi:hypothetical protein